MPRDGRFLVFPRPAYSDAVACQRRFMSENENEQDDELDPNHEQLPADVQALLRQGRKAKEEAEAASAALASAQRELAIERAGIPETPAKALFVKVVRRTRRPRTHQGRGGQVRTPPARWNGGRRWPNGSRDGGAASGADGGYRDTSLQAISTRQLPCATPSRRRRSCRSSVISPGSMGSSPHDGLIGVLPQV